MLISKVLGQFWRFFQWIGKSAMLLFGGSMVFLLLACLIAPLPYVFGVGEVLEERLKPYLPIEAGQSLQIEVEAENSQLFWGEGLRKGEEWIFPDSTHTVLGKGTHIHYYSNLKKGEYDFVREYLTKGEMRHPIVLNAQKQIPALGGFPPSKRVAIGSSGIGEIDLVKCMNRETVEAVDTLFLTILNPGCRQEYVNRDFLLFQDKKAGEVVIQNVRQPAKKVVVSRDEFMAAMEKMIREPQDSDQPRTFSTHSSYLYLRTGDQLLAYDEYMPQAEPFFAFLLKSGILSDEEATPIMPENVEQPVVNNAFLEEYFSSGSR